MWSRWSSTMYRFWSWKDIFVWRLGWQKGFIWFLVLQHQRQSLEDVEYRHNIVSTHGEKWCIKEDRLTAISYRQGGPSPRSCHSMCYDPIRKSIYVLGKYIEVRAPSTSASEVSPKVYESDFFQYFTDLDKWIKISDNTQVKRNSHSIWRY